MRRDQTPNKQKESKEPKTNSSNHAANHPIMPSNKENSFNRSCSKP